MGDDKPMVSVIIPTHNRAGLVSRAIQSALDQTFRDLEVIVVDDGSSDNTKEVIEKIVQQDSRVQYIRHEVNKGVSAARNTAILQARGEYIAFLDSDCTWMPEKIEKQLEVFRKGSEKVGVVSTGFTYLEGSSPRVHIREGVIGEMYSKLMRGICWPGGPSSMLIKKGCFDKVGLFDENLPLAEDNDICIRISKYYHFDTVAEPLVVEYRAHEDRLSKNLVVRLEGKKRLLNKYEHEIPRISRLRFECNYYISQALYSQSDVRQARLYLRRALLARPLTVRRIPQLIVAFLPYSIYKPIKSLKDKYIG